MAGLESRGATSTGHVDKPTTGSVLDPSPCSYMTNREKQSLVVENQSSKGILSVKRLLFKNRDSAPASEGGNSPEIELWLRSTVEPSGNEMAVALEIEVKLFHCRNIDEVVEPKSELGMAPVNWFMLRSMYVSSVNGAKALIVPCIEFEERDKYRRVVGKAGGSWPEIWFSFRSKWNKGLETGLRSRVWRYERDETELGRGPVKRFLVIEMTRRRGRESNRGGRGPGADTAVRSASETREGGTRVSGVVKSQVGKKAEPGVSVMEFLMDWSAARSGGDSEQKMEWTRVSMRRKKVL
ncbi:hypothetical protein DY000_02004462 [Brassica cretica]|uniref:Uncharacterized protein n=1 Tax=Brassica cretica TaxID=69181 RepID=A0ABQ7BW49_BRACR|nr:hypothetical protein DY000_02004462 [Brassica cretica]